MSFKGGFNPKTKSEWQKEEQKKSEQRKSPRPLRKSDKEMSTQADFIAEEPLRSMEDLVVSEKTKNEIEQVLAKIEHHHILYEEWNLKKIDPYGGRTTINFHGPPGTGKTFAAEAFAKALNKKIIKVSYAELESKYVGETPKNIKKAFKTAKEQDAVLFFDEADSILGKRLTNVTQSADHGVNVSRSVMLLELNHFDGVVIFATNLAKNYDAAFERRILAHIEMPLPDEACLRRLFQLHLPEELPKKEIDFEVLSQKSKGLSGGDILNVVLKSASKAVGREAARYVTMTDLGEAISEVLSGKEAINGRKPEQKTEVMEVKDAPQDIQDEVVKRENTAEPVSDTEKIYSNLEGLPMSKNDWRAVIGLWWLVIGADGVLDPREFALLQQLVQGNRVNHLGIVQECKDNPPKLEWFDAVTLEREVVLFALRDGMQLALCDDEYDETERHVLETVAEKFSIEQDILSQMEAWVLSGLHWREQGQDFLKN